MELLLRILGAAVIIGVLVHAARVLDRRWRTRHPEEKPFAWGYFQALCFFPSGLLWFIALALGDATSWQLWLMVLVYGVAGSCAGYVLITGKKRWAWLFVVLAQLNLLTWTINLIYSQSRWKEFR